MIDEENKSQAPEAIGAHAAAPAAAPAHAAPAAETTFEPEDLSLIHI